MTTKTCRLMCALTMAFVMLIPPGASAQALGAREDNTALQGTNLTYYAQPDFNQCSAACASNPNCKGHTWIQAGTYKAGDAAMCYLMSAVTGRTQAKGHYSAVKVTATAGAGAREDNTALQGTNLTYYAQPDYNQCNAACASNPNCKGHTWIQAGIYKAGDAAMCYLMSAVTGRTPARGHYSVVKGGGTAGGVVGAPVGGPVGGPVSGAPATGGLYSGKWEAYSFGSVTLQRNGNQVTGRYLGGNGIQGPGNIQGAVQGDQFVFSWRSDGGQAGQAIWYPFNANYAGKICGTGSGCTPEGYQDVFNRN